MSAGIFQGQITNNEPITKPVNKEKHFLITELKFDDEGEVIHCLIEAVISNRSEPIEWEVLKNTDNWLQGWK